MCGGGAARRRACVRRAGPGACRPAPPRPPRSAPSLAQLTPRSRAVCVARIHARYLPVPCSDTELRRLE
ncbi:unnamed protein product, partial [Brenthis ino]